MGTDDIFKKRKRKREYERKRFQKAIRERILIVCEGEKTEPLYFEGFGLTNVDVKGFGANTDSLVQIAIELKRNAMKERAALSRKKQAGEKVFFACL